MASRSCPSCGYVLAPFEVDCPRCAQVAAHPPSGPVPPPIQTTRSWLDIILAELSLLFSDVGRLLLALLLVPLLFFAWILVEQALHLPEELMLVSVLMHWGGLAAIIALGARVAPRGLRHVYFIVVLVGLPLGVLSLIAR